MKKLSTKVVNFFKTLPLKTLLIVVGIIAAAIYLCRFFFSKEDGYIPNGSFDDKRDELKKKLEDKKEALNAEMENELNNNPFRG